MNNLFKYIADYKNKQSLALKMRQRRFSFFLKLLEAISKPITILDVGGTQRYWEMMGYTKLDQMRITILNLKKPEIRYPGFSGLAGDATGLSSIPDKSFDVVFSNSVIEHVGGYEQQRLMAKEIMRVGRRYFVQTPNYYFPIEPHYLFPGFQWLPEKFKVGLIRNFNLGHIDRIKGSQRAKEQIESIRLLRKEEFQSLFPDAYIFEEKIFGMTKSFIAYTKDW